MFRSIISVKKSHTIITVFLVSLFLYPVYCQTGNDSLVKKYIEEYKNDSLNYDFIAALSIIDSTVNEESISKYKKKLDDLVRKLPSEKEEKTKKEKKRIKKIYNQIHNDLFIKYLDNSYFPDIFEGGFYNCVTATAVYAYVFDKLKIPYAIKEAPSHVYLIAYPETTRIHIETTVPGEYAFKSLSDSQIEKAIKELVQFKLVTQEEVNDKGYKDLYYDYFYGNVYLSKNALVGMQYYNKSLDFYYEEEYEKAEEQIEKSLLYFDYPSAQYIYKLLSILTLDSLKFNHEKDIQKLVEVINLLDVENKKSSLAHYLQKIVENDENNLFFIEKASNIMQSLEDKKLRNFSKEFMYEHMIRTNVNNLELDEVFRNADSLFIISSKNKLAIEAVKYAAGQKFAAESIDEELLQTMSQFENKYNFLRDNKRFNSIKVFVYANLIDNAFDEKKEKKGDALLEQFDKHIREREILVNKELLAMVYATVGKYYYKKDMYKKSMKILNKGAEIYPKSKEIKRIKYWIEN